MVSVIVPIYNAENYLEDCICSILESENCDYELILIDDGSTDNSKNICDKYSGFAEHISLYTQENAGVSAARNKGISVAKGNWIVFVDADDIISKNFLKTVCDITESEQDIIMFDFEMSNIKNLDSGNYGEVSFCDCEAMFDGIIESTINGMSLDKNWKCPLGTPWAKAYKRKIIIDNNIRFYENISIGEDKLFNLNYFLKCNTLKYINNKVYYWRKHSDSTMSKYDARYLMNDVEYNKMLKKIMFDNNIFDIYNKQYKNSVVSGVEFILSEQIFNKKNDCKFWNKIKQLKKYLQNEIYQEVLFDHTSVGWYKDLLVFMLRLRLYIVAVGYVKTKKRLLK